MTKAELLAAIKSTGYHKKVKVNLSMRKGELQELHEQALEWSSAQEEDREARQKRTARRTLCDKIFDSKEAKEKWNSFTCVTTDKEDYTFLTQATYRLANALYFYDQVSKDNLFLATQLEKLVAMWEAYRAKTVFENGFVVEERDISDVLRGISYLIPSLQRVKEI